MGLMAKIEMEMSHCVIFALCFAALVRCGSSFEAKYQNVDPDPENQKEPIPYQLRVQYNDPENGRWRHVCGAALLDDRTVITAAHCFDNIRDLTRLSVVAGDLLLNEKDSTEQFKDVKKVIIHPEYTNWRNGNDIAVLHVDKIELNKYARGVWLSPFPTQKISNMSAVISGWGLVSKNSGASNTLQKGSVRILPPEDCLERLTNRMKVPARQGILCAINPNPNPITRACSGESGGPLVIQNYKDGDSTGNLLVGITSFTARDCSRQNTTVLFTEISHFNKWIQANRAEKSDPQSVTSCSDLQEILRFAGQRKETIYPYGNENGNRASLEVLCDFETDGGGWTVIQKRSSGPKQEFNRTWAEYEDGFGSLDGNFWLGLDNIHTLTQNGDQELRIELEDFEGEKKYAKYWSFSISGGSDFYRLSISGFFENSTAGDSMSGEYSNNGMRFTTKDEDNDNWAGVNCAADRGGGWWFNHCGRSFLNGLYFEKRETVPHVKGIIWHSWKVWNSSLAKTEMKIRKRQSESK